MTTVGIIGSGMIGGTPAPAARIHADLVGAHR